jgi:hypothetical protein
VAARQVGLTDGMFTSVRPRIDIDEVRAAPPRPAAAAGGDAATRC